MQAGGDQQTVQESVDAGAEDAVQTNDAVADGNQRTEDDGPDEQQDNGNHDGNNGGRQTVNAALAAEECQPVRQLGIRTAGSRRYR